MLVFVEGGKPSYDGGSGERTHVTLVGASAIPPFQLPPCNACKCVHHKGAANVDLPEVHDVQFGV